MQELCKSQEDGSYLRCAIYWLFSDTRNHWILLHGDQAAEAVLKQQSNVAQTKRGMSLFEGLGSICPCDYISLTVQHSIVLV